MTRMNKAVASFAALAVLAVPFSMASADPQHKYYRRHAANGGCPIYKNQFGELVDCHGWRNYNGFWDNSCFSMQYMPAQFACGARGGRR